MENVGPKWNLISRQSQGLKYDDVDNFSFSETVLAMNIGTGVLLKTIDTSVDESTINILYVPSVMAVPKLENDEETIYELEPFIQGPRGEKRLLSEIPTTGGTRGN